MTISRMQQPRQLYGLGSLVKKITRPIKKIAKSPIGKAALLGAAAYGLGGAKFLGGKGLFTPGQGLSRFGNLKNFALDKLLGAQIERGERGITREGGVFSFLKNYAVNNPGKAALFGLGAAGVAAPFFFGKDEEEEIIEDPFSVTPSSIADIRLMARNRDPSLAFLPQQQFVRPGFYAAEGGTPREMFAGGASKNRVTQLLQLLEGTKDPMDRRMIQEEIDMLLGKFAKGGIADLPQVRMLEGGMPEIDYRQSGGFVPVGKKEKADDVPAMLSKNEFVMTADAVRGMGEGSVEKGAQRMYDQMKQLENRVA